MNSMADYKKVINLKQCDEIVSYFSNNDYEIEVFIGSLLDNYFIEVGENNLKLGKAKVRKYIAIFERKVNCWSSELIMLMTDNYNKFNNLRSKYM